MKIIKCMSELIEDEINDAGKYAKLSLEYKEECEEAAKLFHSLSGEEYRHMERLHDTVSAIIADYRDKHGDPPAEMMAVYDYLHKRQIEKAKEIRIMQDMY